MASEVSYYGVRSGRTTTFVRRPAGSEEGKNTCSAVVMTVEDEATMVFCRSADDSNHSRGHTVPMIQAQT